MFHAHGLDAVEVAAVPRIARGEDQRPGRGPGETYWSMVGAVERVDSIVDGEARQARDHGQRLADGGGEQPVAGDRDPQTAMIRMATAVIRHGPGAVRHEPAR